jgi:2-iminobutanoate/2-iminopropanoate deaminase
MKQSVHTDLAPQAVGPYSQAVVAGNLVFTAGQLPLDPATGKLVKGGIEESTRRVMENLTAVLAAAGTDLSHVVKVTVFLDNMENFAAFNRIYAEYYSEPPPARSAVEVAALPLGAIIEMEMIAVIE